MSQLPFPDKIFLKILQLLPFEDLASCALTSRQFYGIISPNWNLMRKPELSICLYVDESKESVEFRLNYYLDDNGANRVEITKDEIILTYGYRDTPNKVFNVLRNQLRTKAEFAGTGEEVDEGFSVQIRCKSDNQETEMNAMLEFIFDTFYVNMLEPLVRHYEPHHPLCDSVINSLRGINNARGTSVECFQVDPFCVQMYQVLESPFVRVDTFFVGTAELLNLDTSRKFEISTDELDIHIFSDFSQDWQLGNKTINHLKMASTKFCDNITINNIKQQMSLCEGVTLTFEDRHTLTFIMTRTFDQKTLRISYSEGLEPYEHIKPLFMTILFEECH